MIPIEHNHPLYYANIWANQYVDVEYKQMRKDNKILRKGFKDNVYNGYQRNGVKTMCSSIKQWLNVATNAQCQNNAEFIKISTKNLPICIDMINRWDIDNDVYHVTKHFDQILHDLIGTNCNTLKAMVNNKIDTNDFKQHIKANNDRLTTDLNNVGYTFIEKSILDKDVLTNFLNNITHHDSDIKFFTKPVIAVSVTIVVDSGKGKELSGSYHFDKLLYGISMLLLHFQY